MTPVRFPPRTSPTWSVRSTSTQPTGSRTASVPRRDEFFYWSYWEGDPDTNTWTYAPVGPASHDVERGAALRRGLALSESGSRQSHRSAAHGHAGEPHLRRPADRTRRQRQRRRLGTAADRVVAAVQVTTPSTTAPPTQPATAGATQAGSPHTGSAAHTVTTTTNLKGSAVIPPSTPVSTSTTTSSTRSGRRLLRRPRPAPPSWPPPMLRRTVRVAVTRRCLSSSWSRRHRSARRCSVVAMAAQTGRGMSRPSSQAPPCIRWPGGPGLPVWPYPPCRPSTRTRSCSC